MIRFKQIIACFLVTLALFSCSSETASNTHTSDESTASEEKNELQIIASEYPVDTINEMIAEAVTKGISSDVSPENNKGLKSSGVYVSPYYSAQVNGAEIPVYCTAVYSAETGGGVLHSFSNIEIKCRDEFILTVKIALKGSFKADTAAIAPMSRSVTPVIEDGCISAEITEYGDYTFLINGDDQRYAYTLKVAEYYDEEAEIAELIEKYSDRVTVFEAGVHYVDPMIFTNQAGVVIYLKRGALLIANHRYDINTQNDAGIYTKEKYPEEDDGVNGLGIGLPRKAVIGIYGSRNIVIAGHGMIDFSMLDLGERNGITLTYSSNITIRDITLINCPAWTVTLYSCENIVISGVSSYSWKVGSDSFDICNCRDVMLKDCFSRGGDDIYVIKTLAGALDANTENVTVKNCTAWAGKARAFSIAAEVYKTVDGVTFEDCAVIIHDSVWNTDYVASLAIIAETVENDTPIQNVTFKNIEIYKELGRPVLVNVYKNAIEECNIDVSFENITVNNGSEGVKMKFDAKNENNSITAVLKNIVIDGISINSGNIDKYAEIINGAKVIAE